MSSNMRQNPYMIVFSGNHKVLDNVSRFRYCSCVAKLVRSTAVRMVNAEVIAEVSRAVRGQHEDRRPAPSSDLALMQKKEWFEARDRDVAALEKLQATRPLKPPGR